ncbi:hypothetical protein DI396_11030 [Litorivita pollutaquae]|uniref:Alpha/beta hydrolase n=1 Tax=Litorivita pollutaquae TaxID=2200892 RepID=A0A2V4NRW2_9RHOB|nr:hypothetical protein [Litorivita pollutaquae]PYC47476.1 hypothetical protein DI396_11030 [Litorivita pollutaquae]
MSEKQAQVEDILEDETLRLRWLDGTGPRMVVSFTSIQHRHQDGTPRDEFLSAASMDGENKVLFVSDLRWSWYSRAGLMDKIIDYVTRIRDMAGATEICTIGNSMGGYGAMILPRYVPVARVAAFVPQISMHPDLVTEDRWPGVMKNHGTYPVKSAGDVVTEKSGTEFYVTFGRNQKKDMAQAALLPDAPNLTVNMLPRCAHDAAEKMKTAGVLNKAVAAKLTGDAKAVKSAVREYARYAREHFAPTWE